MRGEESGQGQSAAQVAWYLYGLLDEETQTVFYIGVTSQTHERSLRHKADSKSAAWPRYRDKKCRMVTLAGFMDAVQAFRIEQLLIEAYPSLHNKGGRGRPTAAVASPECPSCQARRAAKAKAQRRWRERQKPKK